MNLYTVHQQLENLLDQAESMAQENQGVYPDWLDAEIEKLEEIRDTKLENIGHAIKNRRALVEAIKNEERTMKLRRGAIEASIERMKYIASIALNGNKVQLPTVQYYYTTSKETVVDDLALVPSEFIKTEYSPIKTEIKKSILAGGVVPGCRVVDNINLIVK